MKNEIARSKVKQNRNKWKKLNKGPNCNYE